MVISRPIQQFATFAVVMPASVAFCLWVLLVPLGVDRFAGTVQDRGPPMPNFPIVPGASGPFVKQMQEALIKNGYWVGLTGADGNFGDETLEALTTFLDNNALPVQPKCDQLCWTVLRSPRAARS